VADGGRVRLSAVLTLINIFKPTAQISANPLALPTPAHIDKPDETY
jgi:hypothetical protein